MADFGTNGKLIFDFLLVINSNLPLILHRLRLRDIPFDVQNRYTCMVIPLLRLTPPTEGFPWVNLRKIFHECQRMAKVPNGIEILPKISTS